jgi:hypothetical protein
MTASAALLSKSWTVGKRYRVTMTIPRPLPGQTACAVCEWEPHQPDQLTQQEQRDYYRGRDAALQELNELLTAPEIPANPDQRLI